MIRDRGSPFRAKKTNTYSEADLSLAERIGMQIAGAIANAQLFNDLSKMEKSLQESEQHFKWLVENAPYGVYMQTQCRFEYLNPEAVRLFGAVSADQLLGQSVFDRFDPRFHDLVRERIHLLNEEKIDVPLIEETFLRMDGSSFIVEVSAVPTRWKGHNAAFVSFQDITEKKQAEEALRMLAVRNGAILAAVPDIIMEVDSCKRYIWANHAGLRFFGEDVVGREASYYFEGQQEVYNKVQPLFNGSEDVIYVESWQRRQDGETRLLSWWCKALKDEQGHVTGTLSTARDITDFKRAEDELKRMNTFLIRLSRISRT